MDNTEENDTYYGLKNDIVFKHIFGNNIRKEYTKELICEILGVKIEELNNSYISNSVVLNEETIKKKRFEVDVLLETREKIYDIEMQNESTINSIRKNTMYGMRLYSNQLEKGEDYINTIPVVQICIVNNNWINNGNSDFVEDYYIMSKRKNVLLEEDFKIIIIDLNEKNGYSKISEKLKGWIELIKATSEVEEKKVVEKYPRMKKVVEEMKKFRNTEYVQSYILEEKLNRSNLKLARSEGRNEANVEMAKKMLMNNKDIEEITYYTNLPRKTVMSLKEKDVKYNNK